MRTSINDGDPLVRDLSGPGAVSERRIEAHDAKLDRRDIIRWSPVVAGVFSTIVALVVLSALGVAIGVSAIEPNQQPAGLSTEAAIWGIATAVVAFFLGGFIAARTSAVGGKPEGAFNGVMVGVTAIALTVILIGFGVGNLLGAAAANLGQIAGIQIGVQGGVDAFAQAESSAWATFVGLFLALLLSGLGGLLGHRDPVLDPPARG